jgi:hypothetical protein
LRIIDIGLSVPLNRLHTGNDSRALIGRDILHLSVKRDTGGSGYGSGISLGVILERRGVFGDCLSEREIGIFVAKNETGLSAYARQTRTKNREAPIIPDGTVAIGVVAGFDVARIVVTGRAVTNNGSWTLRRVDNGITFASAEDAAVSQ